MSQLAFFKKYCNSDFQSKLLEGMNELISDMKKGEKSEKEFVNNLGNNLKKIKFLTFKNNKIEIKKENHQKGGSPDDDDDKTICKNTRQIVTSMPPSNETDTLSILQGQMEQLSNELSTYRARPDAVQSQVAARHNQLTHMAMAIEAVRQRQQAINIIQHRENWSRTSDFCNSLLSLTFTGLAGYLSYLVVTLFEGAATFITTGATGIFMLFCISIFQVFISIINGVGTSIPSWMGGGDEIEIVTMSGRDLANNITSAISNGITDTPELNDSISRLQELGYTTKMIAFMILFVMFMIITHIIRIFMTARQFSVGWTGISVGDGRQPLQNISTPVQVPQLTNRNTQDQQSNTNLQLSDINGGKKRKTKRNRKKKNKKKTKKAKKSKKKKNKKSKKTKKARKKRR